MTQPAITLNVLPAGYGDSLLVECWMRSRPWRLLIDTGPDECLSALKDRLGQLPITQGKRHIDLAVISHIDHDHIGAASALFADRTLGLTFGDIWFNAPAQPRTRGVAEGAGLQALLGSAAHGLPWNQAFAGADVVTLPQLFLQVPAKRGAPRITLLSPSRASLDTLYAVWARELPKVKVKPVPELSIVERGALDVDTLADRTTAQDRAPANGSSIAFLLEHRGASVLLTADAHPQVLLPALRALAQHRGQSLPWSLDLIKLSHHGSRANTTTELLEVVRATHYVVSTNGAIFGHPDNEGIARVLKAGGTKQVWFNFETERTRHWSNLELIARYAYTPHYPSSTNSGVSIALQPRR